MPPINFLRWPASFTQLEDEHQCEKSRNFVVVDSKTTHTLLSANLLRALHVVPSRKSAQVLYSLSIMNDRLISIPDAKGQGMLVHEGITPGTFVGFGPFLYPVKGRVRAPKL